jgi:hypothetical protein
MMRAADADPHSRGAQLAGTPIGQIVGMMNTVRPVRDVILDMVQEYFETVTRLSADTA